MASSFTQPVSSADAANLAFDFVSCSASAYSPPSPFPIGELSARPTPKPQQPKRGRRKDPAWDEVIVADGIVSCKRCERIIHQLGETHIERVRHHLQKKCNKRLKTKSIALCFPTALTAAQVTAFQKQLAL
ncbi:hypothetical protein PF005_g8499 [Phytophthora fragariae]|uniref:BED-type domain-containing protein n=1 Tax=Phytophthora fragariae TaxID=53985 RepID=A0A6A3F4Z6_9STRA|nr:hypothetical protein PF003_g32102 [Phytophthora fragariae]KAE8940353.1 hypothetical protein PF009_g9832 [Phytophthora fragariae]KAE9117167.1 hypothetical protein PF007_g9391 [Phytophthora fragariae]KAE9118421.1 hypothetical protein PF010_g8229 [Phytophthora fragariae]KAE9147171.1 hypothetical protein PF006_g8132 [Phytophthora fragariae]